VTASQTPTPVSIAEYLEGEASSPAKHEYLGGAIHAMAGGSNRHNTIAGNAFASFHLQLRGGPCRPFNSDTKVRIDLPDHTRFYYPDAMVVCTPNAESDHYQERPVVLVEVLSDATRRTDLGEKRDAYRMLPSLKALLFIESATASILANRRKADGGFAEERYEGTGAIVPLPEIEATLALADLYAGIDFAE